MRTDEEFWKAVDTSGGPDACWPWTLSRTRKRRNYGQVNWQGTVRRAHIVAYELAIGPVPEGLPLDHTCHDPNTCVEPCQHTACCNPAHLEPVTQAENNARRARRSCGAGHPKSTDHGYVRDDNGQWRCRTCESDRQRERRQNRSAA